MSEEKVEKLHPGAVNIAFDRGVDDIKFSNGKPTNRKEETSKQNENSTKKRSFGGFFKIFAYADAYDVFFMLFGLAMSVVHGVAIPSTIWQFSSTVDIFISDEIALKTHNAQASSTNATYTSDNLSAVLPHCYNILYLGLVILISGTLHQSCWNYTGFRQASRLRCTLFKSIMSKHCAWFDFKDTGEFITNITTDIVNVEDGISHKTSIAVQLLTVFASSILTALAINYRLSLVSLAMSPLIVAAFVGVGVFVSKLMRKKSEAYGKAGNIATEILSEIKTVKTFGGEAKGASRYNDRLQETKRIGIKKGVIFGLSFGFLWMAIFNIIGVTSYYGTMQDQDIDNTNKTGGRIVFSMLVIIGGMMSLGQALPNVEQVSVAGGSAMNLFETISKKSEIDYTAEDNGHDGTDMSGEIEFENVYFSYPTRPDHTVLKGFSLKGNAGDTLAFVGASGCGKSTICQLLLRLYDVQSGQILVDGRDVRQYNVSGLRRQMGVVSQEPVLFDGSVEENIAAGSRSRVSRERVIQAAKLANAHEFIMKWPEQYDTQVGAKGTRMSGGEKQRIAIARAVLLDPKVLILDEATSALDTVSERNVQTALEKACTGRTTIIVAHRLSTIVHATRIHYVHCGEVTEQGSHEQLMQIQGRYYAMVNAQQCTEQHHHHSGDRKMSINNNRETNTEQQKEIEREIEKEIETELDKNLSGGVITRILRLNKPEAWMIALACLGSIVVGGAQPILGYLYSSTMKNFARYELHREEALKTALDMVFIIIGFSVFLWFMHILSNYLFSTTAENLVMRLRRDVMHSILRQPVEWFEKKENGVGILCYRLSRDTMAVLGVSGIQLGLAFQSFSAFAVAFIIGIISSWKLSLVITAFIPFLVMGGILRGKDVVGSQQQYTSLAEQGSKVALEAINNIKTVASLGMETSFIGKFEEVYRIANTNTFWDWLKFGFYHGFGQAIIEVCYSVAIMVGAKMVDNREIEFFILFRVLLALVIASITIGRVSAFAPDLTSAKMSARKLFQIVDSCPASAHTSAHASAHLSAQPYVKLPEPIEGERIGGELTGQIGDIAFKDTRFTYASRQGHPVLQGLTFEVKQGTKVALVGESGCGKSTAFALLQKFYDVPAGSITVNGACISEVDTDWLRSEMGVVNQEPVLFNATIKENILYGVDEEKTTMDDVIKACKLSNIHEFIMNLRKGYDTFVGEGGDRLSGGQKQRISIARAVIRQPSLILLDEATSALDPTCEKEVQKALDNILSERTSITIAHKLKTIENSDKIFVLCKGSIVESGTHSELLKNDGIYHKMVLTQKIK